MIHTRLPVCKCVFKCVWLRIRESRREGEGVSGMDLDKLPNRDNSLCTVCFRSFFCINSRVNQSWTAQASFKCLYMGGFGTAGFVDGETRLNTRRERRCTSPKPSRLT